MDTIRGKLEPGEAPYHCANRELFEEAGLVADNMLHRGVINIVVEKKGVQWLLFAFVGIGISGTFSPDKREGDIQWWPISKASTLPMPQSDQIFFPHVIDLAQPAYYGSFSFDKTGQLVKKILHSPL